MKIFGKITTSFVLAVTAISLTLSAATVSAAQVPYDPNGTPTAKTPVFNNFTNVPSGVGDESDFVRLRPSSGDVTSTANNGAYTSTLSSACNTGDKFDVRTYSHNGADPNFNENGNGSAVAKNVAVAMRAPLGSTESSFTFTSTISASNAASVTDSGVLNCGNKKVKLTLVPGSIKSYSKNVGFNGEADSAVNGSLAIGSRSHGSGVQWACFDDRVTVAYIVQVEEVKEEPKPAVVATCDMLKITVGDNRTVRVSEFKYTATNATVKNVVLNWNAGKSNDNTVVTDPSKVVGQTHTYAADGTYLVNAVINLSSAENPNIVASTQNCQQQVTFTTKQQPVVTTVTTTPVTPIATRPAALPKTGAGSIIAIFGASAIAGTIVYRRYLGRTLA